MIGDISVAIAECNFAGNINTTFLYEKKKKDKFQIE